MCGIAGILTTNVDLELAAPLAAMRDDDGLTHYGRADYGPRHVEPPQTQPGIPVVQPGRAWMRPDRRGPIKQAAAKELHES